MALGPNESNMLIRDINHSDTSQLLVYTKLIDLRAKRYQGFLFPDSLPSSMISREFIVLPSWFPKTVEEAVEFCINATVETLTQ